VNISAVPAWHVAYSPNFVCGLSIGLRHWRLGLYVETWGVRLMLVWWHVCLFW
jgi:hypothetical protein